MVNMIRSDLEFILAQILIAEADARGETLLGTYIPNPELPWGLRRVDGSNNNLTPGQGTFGSADQPFPNALDGGTPTNEADDGMRFGPPVLITSGPNAGQPVPGFEGGWFMADGTNDPADPNELGAVLVPAGYAPGVNYLINNNFGVHTPNNPAIVDPRAIQPGDVVDADPRLISNLVADQTVNNPAAVFKALQVAESADPFADMQVVVAAAKELAAAKAAGKPLLDALALAQQNVATAQAALAAANAASAAQAATIAAYEAADAATDQLVLDTAAVDTTTTNLRTLLEDSASVQPEDLMAVADALTAANALLASAQAVQAALASDPNTDPADSTDIALFISLIGDLIDALNGIELGDNTVNTLDTINAAIAEVIGDGAPVVAGDLDAQIDASLATALAADPGIALATANLEAAEAALVIAEANAAPAQAAIALEQTKLQAVLDGFGIAYEESPTGDFGKATLFIPNVAPDAGLSSPFNSWMTLFGQFFDHGLDLVGKGGFGTVYVPLQPDDPLYVQGSRTNFMALTRSTLDENGNAINKVTPFVDQNQTYTSNASAQVFHREYEMRDGKPFATGRLLNGTDNGLATWADIKAQALEKLGIELNDHDIHNIPELIVDPYGNFIPGANGFPQLVRSIADGVVIEATEGNPADPARTADRAVSTGHAFLDDIAHAANPASNQVGDADSVIGITTQANPAFNATHVGPETFLLERTANVVANPNFDVNQAASQTNPEFLKVSAVFDNELLDRHFITGDGRGNENIGLTAVHTVFHAEHNRQIDLIKGTLIADAQAQLAGGASQADAVAFLNAWLAVPVTTVPASVEDVVWNGERLFQAAKFPTEMQYQHLVFEEFARTVQPFVNVFNDFNGQLDAAILAEFAHVVYRFGHSMLNETVDRLTPDNQTIGSGGVVGADQIGLIEAFLNPVEFNAGDLSAEDALAAISRGMTRQRGNEIDEFVTEALRNNLVGLPLDLATLNIARGRETNVPTLNEARAQFYAGSSDAQVRPYVSWADFAANIKNPVSVVNFIAAYGTHASITSAVTLADKRDAAMDLVLGGAGAPTDRLDFLNARNAYAGGSLGGLNDVDFWIGGLAEKQMAFGGMLGTTFNFVFEVQLENLQNGDRFYYLSRLANLNLTAQLENNKFAEMIDRNVDGLPLHLPGNVFKAMDYQLEVDQTRQFNAGLGSDDPTGLANGLDPFLGAINGDRKVIRDGDLDLDGNTETLYDIYDTYLQFVGGEHVVLGGTAGRDILIGDEGDDTLWGDDGDDRLEGGIGNDFVFGGEGNDIITDQFGDDEIRSGGGDDVVSAGQGVNLIITDTGNDFVWAGDDLDELLLGQGNDFGAGGADEDMLVGGEGNDWLESGLDNGLMLGDNGDLVQGLPIKRSVDSTVVGHDVLVNTGGNQDFDAETGDDIMVGGLGTDRFFGQFGFDWASHKNDPYGVDADMNNRQFAPPQIAASPGVILDRYAQTEALSGSSKTDFLRGDDETTLGGGAEGTVAPGGGVTALGLANPGLDHALKDANVALIGGLDAFLGTVDEEGENRFSAGNIILGGAGSDIIEGRGGNDLIDGDRWLNVRISVRDPSDHSVELFSVDGMKDIQARMFSGEIKVSQLEIVREIITDGAQPIAPNGNPGARGDVDVAQYSGVRDDYDITNNADGSVTITHLVRNALGVVVDGLIGTDGVDRLTNVERVLFADQTIKLVDHANVIATGAAEVTWDPTGLTDPLLPEVGTVLHADLGTITDVDGLPLLPNGDPDFSKINIFWQVETAPGSGVWSNISLIVADEFAPAMGPTFTLTAAEAGLNVRVRVQFVDGDGAVETANSPSIATSGAGVVPGGAGLPVVPDPAAELGLDLTLAPNNVDPDGVAVEPANFLPGAPVGIFEDMIDNDPATNITAFTITRDALLANVVDPDTPAARLQVIGLVIRARPGDPDFGTLTNVVTDVNGNFVSADFDPAPNFNGGVVFTFEVSDGVNLVPAEATLNVLPVNDAPSAPTAFTVATIAADAAPKTVTFDDTALLGDLPPDGPGRALDIDGDRVVILAGSVALAAGQPGTLVDNLDGTYAYTPPANFFGDVTINYTIDDGTGLANATTATSTTLTVGRTFNGVGNTVDNVNGTAARDVLNGNGGADTLNGLAGNDSLNGGNGADTLNGGDGDDALVGGAGGDTINGGAGNDTIVWSVGDGNGGNRDVANGGLGGTDTYVVNGDGSAETFTVFAASNWLELGGGRALLNPNSDIVITRGTTGNSAVIAELDEIEEIVINTGAGADVVNVVGDFTPTNLAFNTIHVNNSGGDDEVDLTDLESEHRVVLFSSSGTGSIIGQRPQDVLDNEEDGVEEEDESGEDGSSGDNSGSGSGTGTTSAIIAGVIYYGTLGNDGAFGDSGNDRMSGGAGDDTLFGYDGDDSMVGGDGADELFSGKGDDVVLGGSGNDRVFADAGNDMLLGGAGSDHLDAGDGNDQIWGDQGRDVVKAGLGNDVIFAMAGDGNDVYDGGDGIDTADYSAIATGIVFDLEAGIAKSVGAGNSGEDVLKDIENIVGGSGNDTFYANNAVNVFEGGGGNDTFVFRTAASANGDRIEGFAAGDVIKLSNIFGEITESSFVDNGTFTAAGQIRLVVANGDTRIEGNIDGDADADFSLTVEDYLVRKDEII